MMTDKHLRWAQSHDWGREAVLINGQICGCLDVQCGLDDQGQSYTVTKVAEPFATFQDLKEWAGY